MEYLCWSKPHSAKVKKIFPSSSIQKIVQGRETVNFSRFPTMNFEKYENSFSIVLASRTIDLESVVHSDMQEFCTALKYFINLRKSKNH
jgi:hypothetical protein